MKAIEAYEMISWLTDFQSSKLKEPPMTPTRANIQEAASTFLRLYKHDPKSYSPPQRFWTTAKVLTGARL